MIRTFFVVALASVLASTAVRAQETNTLEVRSEKVLSEWPDGTPKVVDVRYADGTRKQTKYREDGSRWWEYRHDARGKTHPTVTRWNKSGEVFVVEKYDHGKKIGIWVYHDEEGKAVARLHFRDGQQVRHETWNSITKAWQEIERLTGGRGPHHTTGESR